MEPATMVSIDVRFIFLCITSFIAFYVVMGVFFGNNVAGAVRKEGARLGCLGRLLFIFLWPVIIFTTGSDAEAGE